MRYHDITINAYIFLIVIAAMLRNKTAREVSYPVAVQLLHTHFKRFC